MKQTGYLKPGQWLWFEYHCWEDPKSCDAALWIRSHNKVKVLGIIERGYGRTPQERGDNGESAVYKVRFTDGFTGKAFEDELVANRGDFFRPDPPYPLKKEVPSRNPYDPVPERMIWADNPTAPDVSDYEGMTVEYTPATKLLSRKTILTHDDFVGFAREIGLLDDVRERMYAVYLNNRNKPMGYRLVSTGARSSSIVDPTVVFGPAVALHASSVILLHNHVAGNPLFSPDDLAVTRRLVTAGTSLGIKVLDHIIVAGETGAISLHEDFPGGPEMLSPSGS